MKYKDYYAILGVARDANEDAIKKAYRRLARKYHPDVSKETDAKERFQELSEAYETLNDKEKRAAYDNLGSFKPGQDFRPPPDWQQRYSSAADDLGGIDLSDLFAHFGAGRRGGQSGRDIPFPGEDFEVPVRISLDDAMRGTEISLELSMQEVGPDGRIVRTPKTIRARIPAGATDGQKLRLRGKGAPGINGGRDGDLYLDISLLAHPLYRASGHDLYLDLPVTPWEAALGAEIEVPTPNGRVTMKIPAGSTPGRRLRLSGRGMPKPAGGAGDLYAVLGIAVPDILSDKERELFEALKSASSFDPRAHFAK